MNSHEFIAAVRAAAPLLAEQLEAVRYLQPQSMATLKALGRCPAGGAG
ncbi:MAG: hypothetical protein HZB72_07640 [Burkholderiales bacterium]|nr:hypothetical protein [Burkholderiales bacterium]